ncbi:MAG: valine--tRNA ligase [Nanoarchaeota archaeon]|nr:valine--tRNA ligase [Nanoarchaeota archaeon]
MAEAKELPKKYEFKESEPRIKAFWEKNKVYSFDKKSKAKIFSVDTPPPTVSGDMHLGHAFSYSQQDFVIRYKRMQGFSIFYPFGTDDNGLATDKLVEKLNNVRSKDFERGKYIELCLKTLEKVRPKFIEDWKHLAISCDFSLAYSTINPHCRKLSQKSFIDLYNAGREYRKEAPTIWCPFCHTAIAQVEMEDKEIESTFNDIVFKVDGKELIIATTRPEMLGSCVAIFAHPDDKRYKPLFNKKAKVPLFNHEVPILPDEKADPEKGTGIVMCCTFGDQTDVEWYKQHNLPLVMSIDKNGKMNEKAGKYNGLAIKEARKQIIEDLKEAKLLKNQKPITHPVNVHERCGTELEIINSKQWFIKYLDLKGKFLDAGNKLHWYPDYMKIRYDNWIAGLKWDWCISRQRHYGIPFPVWYCRECGEVILADEKQLPVDPLAGKPKNHCPKCKCKEILPETDVMDTWATSSLTPQIAASLVPDMYDRLYPMNLRPNAHDIITFWLFNTVVKSQMHSNVNPWQDVMVSGFALDPHGKKMSKSKGNAIKPQEMFEKYGVDALRFWAAGSKLGQDLPFQEKDLVTGAKTVTKLWNASKFALMHLEDYDLKKPNRLEASDRWLLSKLNKVIKDATEHFEKYEYSKTKHETEKLFWQVFCDNYLEMIKGRLYNKEKNDSRLSAQYTLYHSLLGILKLFAPIMPYITEEIYQLYFADKEKCKSIHNSSWPSVDESLIDDKLEEKGDYVVEVIAKVRKAKSEKQISLGKEIKSVTIDKKEADVKEFLDDLKATAKAESIQFGKEVGIEL